MEEATHRGQIKKMEKEFTDAEAIKLQGSEVHRKHVKAALHGQIEKPGHKLIQLDIDKETMEAILHGRNKQLEWQRQQNVSVKEELVTALQEKDRNSATLGFKPRCKCRQLREFIEKIDSEKKQLESDLREKMEFYEMRLQDNEKSEAALYTLNEELLKELQERKEAIAELQAKLKRQYEELCVVRLERESLNRRIQELENETKIKELNNKDVESSVCSKMKELAAVSMAVGVVAAVGWWLLS
jgi:chromosome segregation ATPase